MVNSEITFKIYRNILINVISVKIIKSQKFINNLVDLIECFRLICYMTYFDQKHGQKWVNYREIIDFFDFYSFCLLNYSKTTQSIDFNNLYVILKANISSF